MKVLLTAILELRWRIKRVRFTGRSNPVFDLLSRIVVFLSGVRNQLFQFHFSSVFSYQKGENECSRSC